MPISPSVIYHCGLKNKATNKWLSCLKPEIPGLSGRIKTYFLDLIFNTHGGDGPIWVRVSHINHYVYIAAYIVIEMIPMTSSSLTPSTPDKLVSQVSDSWIFCQTKPWLLNWQPGKAWFARTFEQISVLSRRYVQSRCLRCHRHSACIDSRPLLR